MGAVRLPEVESSSPEEPGDATTVGAPVEAETSEVLPLWFERGLIVVTAAVLWFGGFGLFLAVLGDYHFLAVVVVGLLGTLGTSLLAWPKRRTVATRPRGVVLPAVGMCLVAVVFLGWNSRYSSHQVAIGRDPGVYAVTGKWIATHGNLEVRTGTEWSSKGPGTTVATLGTYAEGNNELQFQFDHLTSVLLAEADNLGGDGLMFKVPALLGALALGAIYAAGCRLVRRPWLVLAAVVALGISLPQLNVSRDPFSEPSVELLLWSGMWLISVAYSRRSLGMAWLAGMALVGTIMSRIDAPVYLIPLPVLAALTWLSASSPRDRRFLARLYGAFILGAIPVAVLGTIDIQDRSGRYYDDLHGQVHQLQVGLLAATVAALLLVILWPLARGHVSGWRDWATSQRNAIGTAAGCVVALGLVAAWGLRPAIMHSHGAVNPLVGALQTQAGLPSDPTRTYAEYSVTWISWYLGPITVALACIGAAVLTARTIRRPSATSSVVLTVAGIGTALYLWRPSISPDQIWVMRRYVPAALPLFVLLAAVALSVVVDLVASRARSLPAAPLLATGAAAMLVFPLGTTLPVRAFQPESGYLAALDVTCRATGHRAAILTAAKDPAEQEMVAGLRTWCNVPVASLTASMSAEEINRLADEWRSEGRTLWILGSTPALVSGSAPGLSPKLITVGTSPRELEFTLNRPPSHYVAGTLSIYASRVAP
jgi:hypothetical protein